jgi:hypothetical protein
LFSTGDTQILQRLDLKSAMRIYHYKAEMTLKGNREWREAKRSVDILKSDQVKVARILISGSAGFRAF